MTWVQTATLIVSIAAAVAAGTGVIVLSVNGIHSQVAALQSEAAADRRAMQTTAAADRRAWQATMDAFREKADADREAFRAQAEADREAFRAQAEADWEAFRGEVRRLGERQAHVEGALSTAAVRSP